MAGVTLLATSLVSHARSLASPRNPCVGHGTSIVVDTKLHRLSLCERQTAVQLFSIRIGRAGTGKRRRGDNKTPLGVYALGPVRKSSQYGTFIPIGYPTESQKRAGFTGGGVGIHGPHRSLRWAGRLNNLFDSTEGCVGVASDAEMKVIADFVKSHRPLTVAIE